MKRLFVFNSFFLVFTLTSQILAQTSFSPTMASRLMTFDSNGLLNAGTEVLLPMSDSAAFSLNYGMKTLRLLDGVYYQVLTSKKSGSQKVYLRKSQDGINWGGLVKAGDSPADTSESLAGIYVSKKDGNVNVGVIYTNNRDGDYRFLFFEDTSPQSDTFFELFRNL